MFSGLLLKTHEHVRIPRRPNPLFMFFVLDALPSILQFPLCFIVYDDKPLSGKERAGRFLRGFVRASTNQSKVHLICREGTPTRNTSPWIVL